MKEGVDLLFDLLMVSGIVYVFCLVKALRRWRGGWRLAAWLTLVAPAACMARVAIDVIRDPTSHNLWPFELVMWSGGGTTLLGAVALCRRLAAPKEGPPG